MQICRVSPHPKNYGMTHILAFISYSIVEFGAHEIRRSSNSVIATNVAKKTTGGYTRKWDPFNRANRPIKSLS